MHNHAEQFHGGDRLECAAVTASRLVLICVLWSTAAFAQLDKAEKALKELEYANALKALEVAKKQSGNDRATTLRILELQAITLATMGQEAKALKAFQQLLSLVPEFSLSGNHPPRVTTVLYEARGWLDLNKPLVVEALPAVKSESSVSSLKAEVSNDPLKMVKELRFRFTADGKAGEIDVPVTGKSVSTPVSGAKVEWSVQALGEKKSVLLALPARLEQVSSPPPTPPVAVAQPKKEPEPAPRVEPKKDPEPEAQISEWAEPAPPAKPMPVGRIAAIGLMGGGVAVAGLGVVFGVLSGGTKALITNAEKDADGRITSLTQKEALELDARQRTEATVANVMLISGGLLAAGGVTLFVLTRDEATVALVPAPGGLLVTGNF